MSIPIKLYLHRDWNEKAIEIRRILLDSDMHADYAALVEKIGQLFPALCTDKITIAWLDEEEDIITISSDQELNDALEMYNGTMFRLLIKEQNELAAELPSHSGSMQWCHKLKEDIELITTQCAVKVEPYQQSNDTLGYTPLSHDLTPSSHDLTPLSHDPFPPEPAIGTKRPMMSPNASSPVLVKRPKVFQDHMNETWSTATHVTDHMTGGSSTVMGLSSHNSIIHGNKDEQNAFWLLKDMGYDIEDGRIVQLVRDNHGNIQAIIEALCS